MQPWSHYRGSMISFSGGALSSFRSRAARPTGTDSDRRRWLREAPKASARHRGRGAMRLLPDETLDAEVDLAARNWPHGGDVTAQDRPALPRGSRVVTVVALLIEELGVPFELVPVESSKASNTLLPSVRSTRTERSLSSSMTMRRSSTPTRSWSTSPRSKASSSRHPVPGARRRSRGSPSSRPGSRRFRARQCTSSTTRRSRFRMRRIAI